MLLLPGIQREFVWKDQSICEFFESIYLSLPIGSCIFWEHNYEEAKNHHSFKFIEKLDYWSEKQGRKATRKELEHSKYQVVDGQQRLTSLFLGLKGYKRLRGGQILHLSMDLSFPQFSDKNSPIDFAEKRTRFKFRQHETDPLENVLYTPDQPNVWFKVWIFYPLKEVYKRKIIY